MRIWGLVISRKSALTDESDTPAVRKRVQRLEIELQELQESLSALQGAHAKLRNQFHGSKGGRPADAAALRSADDIPRGDKASLRLAAGLLPGRVRSITNREE